MNSAAVEHPVDIRQSAPAYLAGASAATSLVSIAASQILLGMAVIALFFSPRPLRWPRAGWPLIGFVGWTLISLAASPDPAGGLPQIKKFYVYLMLWVVASSVRRVSQIRWIFYGWAAGGALSALWGFVQYAKMYLTTEDYFYLAYSNSRITGFMGHWMTFSGTLMMAIMMTGAMVLFDSGEKSRARNAAKYRGWAIASIAIMTVGVLAAFTRSVWGGTIAGALWLLWAKRPRLVALVPVGIAIVLAANPFSVRDRVMDAINPQSGAFDTVNHRAVLRGVGWEIMKDRPLVGVGPEQVEKNFYKYLPDWAPNPVPDNWYYAHLHNVYIHYGAERGVPAMLLLIGFLGTALWDFGSALRRSTLPMQNRWILHGAIASILGIMVSGLAEVNLGDSEVLGMFLAIVACGYIALGAKSETAENERAALKV